MARTAPLFFAVLALAGGLLLHPHQTLAGAQPQTPRCHDFERGARDRLQPAVEIFDDDDGGDAPSGDRSVTLAWATRVPEALRLYELDCPPISVHATVFCDQLPAKTGGDASALLDYQLGGATGGSTYTVDNLARGADYNCTVTEHRTYPHQVAIQSTASALRSTASAFKASEECDQYVASLTAEQLFLGVVDTAARDEVEFSWHFPDGIAIECLDRFSIECRQVPEDVGTGMKNAASAVQHRAGTLDPSRQNLGLAVLEGLETGLIYSCALRVRDGSGNVQVASESVWVEPGYPKLLKDTSRGEKCAGEGHFGLIRGGGLFVRDGCEGVFLLPGDLGLVCRSTDASYVECYLPGQGKTTDQNDLDDEAAASATPGNRAPFPYDGIEVYFQTSSRECVPRKTFGFTSPDEMFVVDGCEGQFIAYHSQQQQQRGGGGGAKIKSLEGGEGEAEMSEASDFTIVDCRGDARRKPAYAQTVQRRRWWCLFLCKTSGDDPDGFYTCPVTPAAQGALLPSVPDEQGE